MELEPYISSSNIYCPMADKKQSPLGESQIVGLKRSMLDSASTTEEMSSEDHSDLENELIAESIRLETKNWLDLHGSKLYALEFSKYLAQERKREALKKKR